MNTQPREYGHDGQAKGCERLRVTTLFHARARSSCSGISPRDAHTAIDVARWRKSQRERLIAERLAVPADARAEAARRIAGRLDAEIGTVEGSVVGIYWPFPAGSRTSGNGPPAWRRGGQLALPVVREKGKPLEFRTWSPGEKLEKGVWNIPVPAGGVVVLPDIVVAPVVGYDEAGFRLGYSGGFYDRTLAAMPSRPLTFGVGYALARLQTIYPQWHDIPLDRMVIDDEMNSSG